MLLGNYTQLNANPGKNIGGFTNPYAWRKVSNAMSFYVGDHVVVDITNRSGLHNGYNQQYALVLPLKVGGIALNGSGGIGTINYANLAGGILLEADLAGIGTINSATGSLLAFATSALSGIGSLNADILGQIQMAADLNGSGNTTAALGALSGAVCSIIGTGSLSGDITGTLEASADLSGVGLLTVLGSALLELEASLSGTGSLTGSIQATGNIESDLAGTGSMVGSIKALAFLISNLQGTSAFNIISSTSPGYMSADISAIGEIVTPATVAAAVWNAVAADFNNFGTMGELMNDAGAGGNPWDTLLEAGLTAGDIMLMLKAFANGEDFVVDNIDGTKTYYSLACYTIN